MEKIKTEKEKGKLDMFQSRFGKIDDFGWLDLERISADTGMQYTSMNFKEYCQTIRVHLTIVAPKYQEINGKIEVT